jgi:hypothetical protein
MNDFLGLIGTPRYPLNIPQYQMVFEEAGSSVIEDEGLSALMRQVHKARPFQSGYCYTNTERVLANGEANGWSKIIPFAGWLLIGNTRPVHHAWAVYKGKVIDFCTTRIPTAKLDEFDRKWNEIERRCQEAVKEEFERTGDRSKGKEVWIKYQIAARKASIEFSKPYDEGDIIENRVWGVPPPAYIYSGCPCDPVQAREIFRQWHPKYGKEDNHEAPGTKTPMQMLEAGDSAGAEAKIREIAEGEGR